MASWLIHCNDCKHVTNPGTVENLADHCDEMGWFRCSVCSSRGYMKKEFTLQERETCEFYLVGILGGIRNDAKKSVLLTFLTNKQVDGFHGSAALVAIPQMRAFGVVVV